MPPKRKKSAKNKLAKMTEEERAEYLKQQLIKEEQMKKQKEELLVLFLKEKLVKEERAARHNMVRIQNQWIHIMRLFKARDLKSEIESLSKEFEKQIDRKMAITQSLITDMEQSEEQQMMRMRRYAESLDELIGELLSILSKIRWRLEITTLLPERTKCHYIRSLTKPDLLI
eukprot:scpid96136/ scgid4935/ 